MANKRPKGFIDWNPNEEWSYWLGCVNGILEQYEAYLPFTVRQIFYRLVATYHYSKTERAYNNLANALVKARRAGLIDFSVIRDDGGTTVSGGGGYVNIGHFMYHVRRMAKKYELDRSEGQPFHIVMFCEAEGIVDMIGQFIQGYHGVTITGTGGFASLTDNHRIAMEIVERDKPTVFLHLGDYDPSGVSIFESMCQDIGLMVAQTIGGKINRETGQTFLSPDDDGPDFRPYRIALTPEQIDELGLETAPPKSSDSRSARWVGDTVQLEALAPEQLRQIVIDELEQHIDWDQNAKVKARSNREHELLNTFLPGALEETLEMIRTDSSQ